MSSGNIRLKYRNFNEYVCGAHGSHIALTDRVLEYDRAD